MQACGSRHKPALSTETLYRPVQHNFSYFQLPVLHQHTAVLVHCVVHNGIGFHRTSQKCGHCVRQSVVCPIPVQFIFQPNLGIGGAATCSAHTTIMTDHTSAALAVSLAFSRNCSSLLRITTVTCAFAHAIILSSNGMNRFISPWITELGRQLHDKSSSVIDH